MRNFCIKSLRPLIFIVHLYFVRVKISILYDPDKKKREQFVGDAKGPKIEIFNQN